MTCIDHDSWMNRPGVFATIIGGAAVGSLFPLLERADRALLICAVAIGAVGIPLAEWVSNQAGERTAKIWIFAVLWSATIVSIIAVISPRGRHSPMYLLMLLVAESFPGALLKWWQTREKKDSKRFRVA